MRILITGADGQLGTALQQALQSHDLVLAVWPQFDLLSDGAADFIVEARPDLVIHAAAYTDVDGAEREPAKALAVNAHGTERVARGAVKAGARLIYISTDYVFDGHKTTPYGETDAPNPLNAYGRSKLEGERRAAAQCADTLIVRTAWLYGRQGRNFVKTILERAVNGGELRIVNDQRGNPTYAPDLAAAITRLASREFRGILHATGGGDCSWFEFACAIVSEAGARVAVKPITSAESARPAVRPAYGVLSNRRLSQLGIELPPWREALSRFLHERRAVEVKI